MGIGHLHNQQIIHRDLKTENILLDEDGYICITDFGMAKLLGPDAVTHSFVGTPDYLAPELIKSEPYSYPVDWWSLGILIFELICGLTPFYTGKEDPTSMYGHITTKQIQFPTHRHDIPMSENCKDIIS